MKKAVYTLLITLVFTACKKEETEIPAPLTTTTTTTTDSTRNYFKASVNGTEFKVFSYLVSNVSFDTTLYEAYYTSTAPQATIYLKGKVSVGTFNIGPIPSLYTASLTKDTITYNAVSGSITITNCRATLYDVKRLKATFNFNTDTISGVHYNVTGGDFNYYEK